MYAVEHGGDPDAAWEYEEDAREAVRPMLADFGETAQFLAARKVALSPSAQVLFLDYLYEDLAQALKVLIRRAKGDHSPDPYPERFPQFSGDSGYSLRQLVEKWIATKRPAASTVDRWRGVFLEAERHFGASKPAASILPTEAHEWAQGLITERRSAATVRDVWLSALKTVCSWAVRTKLLTTDPFAEVEVTVPRRQRMRETKAFRDDEAARILAAALAVTDTARTFEGVKRWVPWLLAYTGARPGEMTQLRGEDVLFTDPPALRITPEAGTVKTNKARTVPLHEHLVALGFLKFAKAKGKGPLFYNPDTSGREVDPTNPRKARSVKQRERLAGWIRSIGIDDKELSPNHAWRHTFKQRAERYGISERISDYITGHSPASEGRGYGAPTLADMAQALKKFPRYPVGAEETVGASTRGKARNRVTQSSRKRSSKN